MSATLSRRQFGAETAGAALAVAGYSKLLCNRILGPEDAESHGVVRPMSLAGHGERFRKAREARGLTIEQCAYAIDPFNANFWYAHWHFLENNGDPSGGAFMDVWPTVEALLGVSITHLLYGGSDLAQARDWVKTRLNDFEPGTDIEPDEEVSPISSRIKQARESRGLSCSDAAAKAGCTEREWQRYENGGSPVEFVEMCRVADALNVEFDWFLLGDAATVLAGKNPLA
jgi:transcriptional regulator with XRE-family HTH domain